MSETILIRHLGDQEDLRQPDRDCPIKVSEIQYVPQIADLIIERINSTGKSRLEIVSSPKQRTMSTIDLIVQEVRSKSNVAINTYLDSRITGLNHGKFNLPRRYKPGDEFPPDRKAWEIWVDETFNKKNLIYKYGDPL